MDFIRCKALTSWTLFVFNPFVMKKVFNWSELHLSEVTSYKIHTLIGRKTTDYFDYGFLPFFRETSSVLKIIMSAKEVTTSTLPLINSGFGSGLSKGPSMSDYPNFILILSKLYPFVYLDFLIPYLHHHNLSQICTNYGL